MGGRGGTNRDLPPTSGAGDRPRGCGEPECGPCDPSVYRVSAAGRFGICDGRSRPSRNAPISSTRSSASTYAVPVARLGGRRSRSSSENRAPSGVFSSAPGRRAAPVRPAGGPVLPQSRRPGQPARRVDSRFLQGLFPPPTTSVCPAVQAPLSPSVNGNPPGGNCDDSSSLALSNGSQCQRAGPGCSTHLPVPSHCRPCGAQLPAVVGLQHLRHLLQLRRRQPLLPGHGEVQERQDRPTHTAPR
jgi:hypothetical protein